MYMYRFSFIFCVLRFVYFRGINPHVGHQESAAMRFFQCILVLAVAASDAFSITPSAPRVPMAMDASARSRSLMMSAEQQGKISL